MLEKINLSIVCLLLVTLFAIQPCFAGGVQIQPDSIVLNAGGSNKSAADQTIQASIAGTGMVKNCSATLTIDGATVNTSKFHYCVLDDILHIQFDRDDVLEALEGKGTPEGVVYTAEVEATINAPEDPQTLEGSDDVTVIDPEKSPK